MSGFKLLLSRMNGWALSLVLHGGVGVLAAISVFSSQMGGSGRTGDGRVGMAGASESFPATFRAEEPVVSGTVFPDVAQYHRLTSEDRPQEPIAEELPTPPVPFDVFAVGATETQTTVPEPALNPPSDRPATAEGRAIKLPPCSGGSDDGLAGTSGSGGGDGGGNGHGEGSGDGNATGIHTPPPVYPKEARRRNLEGSVRVELAIAADGSCALRRIIESSGYAPFESAVLEAIQQWKYRPADEDGRPEVTTKLIRFTFKLGR